jgi:methionyl-tRNA formyltransferase
MNERVDMGDIVHQKEVAVYPDDTGDTLYKKALALELEVFKEAWPALVERSYRRTPQDPGAGSFHRRRDLDARGVREIDLNKVVRAGDLIDRMRALTTNKVDEAAYFIRDGVKYYIQVKITRSGNDSTGA